MNNDYVDFMSTPAMYRDIGTSYFMAHMPIYTGGCGYGMLMPYSGTSNLNANSKSSPTRDVFERMNRKRSEEKKSIIKAVIAAAAVITSLVLFKKLSPKNISSAVNSAGGKVKSALDKAGAWFKNGYNKFVNLFKGAKAPASTTP